MKITEKPNTYRTTNKKLLDVRHDRLINVHCRDHVTRQKSKQRHRSLKLADFHNQSPLLTMTLLAGKDLLCLDDKQNNNGHWYIRNFFSHV